MANKIIRKKKKQSRFLRAVKLFRKIVKNIMRIILPVITKNILPNNARLKKLPKKKKETIKLQNVVDNKGQMYVGYVKLPGDNKNMQMAKRQQPKAKILAPDTQYKQQVDFNNKGHVPPSYKGIKPPTAMKSGETNQGTIRQKKLSQYKSPYRLGG
jgi:hypothetical protein